jgi:dipeptidase D
MSELINLKPSRVWYYFSELCKVPRPSKKEEKVIEFLLEFGKRLNLETIKDDAGNVLIRKPATPGYENKPWVALQSHIDMVCEKNSSTVHDFEVDPILPYVDGGWVKAKGTTLGADDGIGVAAQMALLEAKDIEHGPIECLFTVDEETGLTGAFALKPGFLKSLILLNLDSEDEGQIFIGCAGGKDTLAKIKYEREIVSEGKAYKIIVGGLMGGHSGDDISKGRGNANKILNRILWNASRDYNIRIAEIDGGNLRNAIAREAYAIIIVDEAYAGKLEALVKNYSEHIKDELSSTDPGLKIDILPENRPSHIIDALSQFNLLNAVYACPHGVIAMSADMPGLVETSTNLASIKMDSNYIIINTSQRSSIESSKKDIVDMVDSVFFLAGAKTQHGDGYPGWKPNINSKILDIAKKSYFRLFNKEPQYLAIHAGLECGLIGEKFPGMDMISFGPTLRGVHSPDERIEIASVEKFWDFTLEILKNV